MPQTQSIELTGDTLQDLQQKCEDDTSADLREFLRLAQTAAWETDGKMQASFVTTTTLKKKVVGDEFTYSIETKSRTHIPKAVIKRELKFEGDQLVFL